jgi:hypothetical protein
MEYLHNSGAGAHEESPGQYDAGKKVSSVLTSRTLPQECVGFLPKP